MSTTPILDPPLGTPSASPWLNALVANVQDAIVVLDSRGQVMFESPSACEILGIPPDDVLGAFGLDRIHPDERDAVIRSFERTIAVPGSVGRATYRFRRADGNWQHLEALAKNLLNDPHLHGVLITFRDVTERTRALEAADRAGRARDEFLSRMGHQLRAPIHAILGWAKLLAGGDDDDRREAIEQIGAASSHLLALVEEALDLAAVKDGKASIEITRVELGEVAAEAMELIRPEAARRDVHVYVANRAHGSSSVLADPDRLRQVLLNLLANAVKYNRYAGDVRIDWELLPDRVIRLSVTDTGPGMSEATLHRVFERFERLGMEVADVEGSGLGLAISSRLVEMMGGTMGVENRPGEGALFWVELPVATD